MSRLDSFIRRLSAQRDCLGHAAGLIEGLPGVVLELGLGNGRTYDHLRTLLPGREIFAFERQLAAHPASIPDADHLVLGDFRETLPRFTLARFALGRGGQAALVHGDFGSGNRGDTGRLAAELGPLITPLLCPGALVVTDQRLDASPLTPLPLPESVPAERYFIYRAT